MTVLKIKSLTVIKFTGSHYFLFIYLFIFLPFCLIYSLHNKYKIHAYNILANTIQVNIQCSKQ